MRVMEVVWPVIALYFGPLAVWGYRRFGGPSARDGAPSGVWSEHRSGRRGWPSPSGSATAGRVAAWATWSPSGARSRRAAWVPAWPVPEYVADYLVAVSLGIVFQYFAIAPMRGFGLRDGLIEAAKADILSLTAFEVGLFAWMALTQLFFFPRPHLGADHAFYWFLMQVGMVVGFFTAWPANVRLIARA